MTREDKQAQRGGGRMALAGLMTAALASVSMPSFAQPVQPAPSASAGAGGGAEPVTPAPSTPTSSTATPGATTPGTTTPSIPVPATVSVGAGQATAGPVPPFLFFGAVSVEEGYTTNAGGDLGAPVSKPDTLTRGTLSLGLHYAAPRLTADASYSLTGDYYNKFHDLDDVRNRLNLVSNAVVVPESLTVALNAFAAPISLSRVGALTPGGEPVSDINDRDSYGYNVTPQYLIHFGDFATSTTSVSQGGVFFVSPSTAASGPPLPFDVAQNTISTTASEQLASGTSFQRLQWALNGSYNETTQTTQSEMQAEGVANLSYALSRTVTLLGSGGYDKFKASVPLTRNLSGPIGLGGVKLTYGPSFSLTVEAGTQHNYPTYLGSLQWQMTARTALAGAVTDTVTTPQNSMLAGLAGLTALPGGGFAGSQPGYGVSSPPTLFSALGSAVPLASDGLSLENAIMRDRTAQMTLTVNASRTTYSVELFGDIRDRLDAAFAANPRDSLYGVNLQATRQLRTDLSANAGASYSFSDEFGGHDRLLRVNAGLNYDVTEDLSLFLQGWYLRRETRGQASLFVEPLADEEIFIGVRRSF